MDGMSHGHEEDDDGDAALAFEALRAEVAALRRGTDGLPARGSRAAERQRPITARRCGG